MGSSLKPSKGKSQDKARKAKEVDIPDVLITHRDRLHQALILGIRFDIKGERKWLSADAMISSRAVKMMSGFIDIMSTKLLYHGLIKDTVRDMLVALEGILQTENETILRPAVMTSTKLLECLGNSLFQYQFSGVVFHLSRLLSSHQSAIVISSAKSLNSILRKIGGSRHTKKEIWRILKETNVIASIIHSLQGHGSGVQPVEHFLELVSLLKEIAGRWSAARYSVWSDTKMMEKLGQLCATLDASITAGILQLCCALALCDDVAMGFIESKQPFLSNLLLCMGSSAPLGIRVEAFRFFQQLVRSEEVCLSLTTLCGEGIVQRIVDAMGGWRLLSVASIYPDQVPLVKEACCAAQMTCWIGKHHGYFWKHGIGKVLADLLHVYYGKIGIFQGPSKTEEFRKPMHCDFPDITNPIWDILGWLSMNCEEAFWSNVVIDLASLNFLISSACSMAVDGILMERVFQHSSEKLFTSSMFLPVFRATLSLVFSPCKYIASQARCTLSGMLRRCDSKDYLQHILNFFSLYAIGNNTVAHDNNQVLLRLLALACFSSLSEYQGEILRKGGLNTLLTMFKTCLRDAHLNWSTAAFHGHICYSTGDEDAETEDIFLLYILQALSQLIPLPGQVDCCRRIRPEKAPIAIHNDPCEESLPEILLQILEKNFSRRVKWYSAYCLSFFGLYGFPSRIGKRMETALDDTEPKDSQLILSDKKSIGVHSVILMSRCPSLLPPSPNKSSTHVSSEELVSVKCLSSRVGRSTLEKLLEFVYTGFFQVKEDDVHSLRILARSCGLDSLHRMLQQKLPLCASPLPTCDFTSALTPLGHIFSDIILEAKETEAVWSCDTCQMSVPHIHAHKIILCSNSIYLHALFRSGMQESSSTVIKVPLSWNALSKLLRWFYSGELPAFKFNCTWTNLDQQTQLNELLVYLEISELAEIWCLDEVREKSIHIIISCLKLAKSFPTKIVHAAYNLKQHEVLEVAVKCLAPLYNQLYDSGEFEEFDEELIEMLRKECVSYSLEDHGSSD